MTFVRRIARPMLASVFVVQGLDALREPQKIAPRVEGFAQKVAGPLGLPQDPELLVRANGAVMAGGGALLATGRLPRLGALAVVGSLVPTTMVGHPFWAEKDPAARKLHRLQFLKNMALLGGLLLAAVDTEGKPGVAYRVGMVRDDATRIAKRTRRDARHAARATKREAKLAAKLAASQAHDALT
jgi:uncharacterized membrane protein YphA (DoxX/SURF4 family)